MKYFPDTHCVPGTVRGTRGGREARGGQPRFRAARPTEEARLVVVPGRERWPGLALALPVTVVMTLEKGLPLSGP